MADSGSPIFDNTGCIGCNLTHTAGFGLINVQIDIDDPADGNPWDGSGSTLIEVFVNGDILRNPNNGDPYSFEKTEGGYTDNFITLYGQRQTFTQLDNLATHTFDNFTVWSAPAFPVDVDADFDDDGDVDGFDFQIWQRGNGLTGQPDKSTGDSDGDGDVDADDLDNWQATYGAGLTSLSNIQSLPEPGTIGMIGVGGVILASLGRLRR